MALIGRREGLSLGRRAALYLFEVYICGIYAVTGIPNLRWLSWEPNINLIPFRELFSNVQDSIGNVVMFLPMGLLLPLLSNRLRRAKTLLPLILSCTVLIELTQLFSFRATDINDVMTNFLGGCLGYGCFAAWNRFRPVDGEKEMDRRILLGLTAFSLAYMFLAQPYVLPVMWEILF